MSIDFSGHIRGKFSPEELGIQKTDILAAREATQPTFSRVNKVALGVIAFLVELPLSDFIFKGTVWVLEKLGVSDFQSQNCIQILDRLEGNCLMNFSRTAMRTLFIAYIVFGAPIIEEWIFRDELYSAQLSLDNHSTESVKVASRVAWNGAIFGLCHLDPLQGWTNVPIFVTISTMGMVLAYLREITGDTTASTTTHMLHNGSAMLQYMGKV